MLFNSFTFIIFFVIVLGAYYAMHSWRARKILLLFSSYLFYAAWNPPFVVLLWISTATDWLVVKRLAVATTTARRRALLAITLLINLGLLAYFKYATFVLDNFVILVNSIGISYQPAPLNIILPVGISFYTFQTLSYTLDIYFKKEEKPWHSFTDYAMYVTFFPQLVAGPIVRAFEFLPQCRTPKHFVSENIGWGFALMAIGLFQKVVLADGIFAPVSDAFYSSSGTTGAYTAWVGTLAFAGQIFCDFSGYSTIAIGVALTLGFKLPENFRYPYAAIGFSDFWERWHISLSSWLRDYVYIPLGGNRRGNIRTFVNLMMTMLIGGLWHGAAWTFVIWGGLHALYLIVERLFKQYVGHSSIWRHMPVRIGLWLSTFLMICITWVFFRADSFGTAMNILGSMFGFNTASKEPLFAYQDGVIAMTVVGMLLLSQWMMRDRSLKEMVNRAPALVAVSGLAGLLYFIITTPGNEQAFIYFQF